MACRGRILVVDPDREARSAVADYVRDMGCCVAVAGDGVAGLAQLRAGPPPCLALVDLAGCRLSGEEFVRRVRGSAFPQDRDLPIVTLSSALRALPPAGVEGHLHKPFDLDVLWPIVERCCRATIRIEAGGLAAPTPLS